MLLNRMHLLCVRLYCFVDILYDLCQKCWFSIGQKIKYLVVIWEVPIGNVKANETTLRVKDVHCFRGGN